MRWLVAIALAACSDKLPDPPSAERFEQMTDQQRCEATEPRGMRCADALLVASAEALGVEDIGSALRAQPRSTDDEARAMYRVQCAGERKLADAVLACWDIKGCRAFADCVMKLEAR